MGNVAEGPRMHKRRRSLDGLQQVRTEGLLQQRCHRARAFQRLRRDRVPVPGQAHENTPEPTAKVSPVRRQGQDRHHFGGLRDDELRLSGRGSVRHFCSAPPQGPVAQAHGPGPGDPTRIQIQRVAMEEMVVQERRQQVMAGRHRVSVAGEMQVDLVHRDHLRLAPAGSPALDAEHRPE